MATGSAGAGNKKASVETLREAEDVVANTKKGPTSEILLVLVHLLLKITVGGLGFQPFSLAWR
jgi:hypothetical protein